MATFSELLSKSQKSLGKTTSQSGASRRSNFYSDRDGFDRLVQRSREELNRPKISQNAGQQQFLNTLTDEEKYEYLLQSNPSRASSFRQTTEQRAKAWEDKAEALRSQALPDPASNYNRNFATPNPTTEELDAIKLASDNAATANAKLKQFNALEKQEAERSERAAMKRAAPTYAMLSTLSEDEVNEYLNSIGANELANNREELNRVVEQNRDLQPWERELNILTSNLSDDYKINSIAAYDPREAARLANMTEEERAEEFRWLPKYGRMNLDQYEKALADAESAFYNYYTTEYNPNDPASVKRYEDLSAEHEWLLNHKDSAWMRSNRKQYEGLEENVDFEKMSATDYSNRDPMYMYINNIGGVQDKDESKDVYLRYGEGAASSPNPSAGLYEKYKNMTDEEVAMYNYLYKTKGKEAAEEYLTFAEYAINARNLEQTREEAADAANKNLFGASLDSVGKSAISGIGFLDAAVQKAGQVTSELFGGGIAAPVDYNTAAMQPSVYASTVLQVGAENLNKKHGTIEFNEDKNPLMARIFNGKGWGDVYQMGMSQLNSLAGAGLSAIVPSLGLFTLASSAATNEMLNTVEKGGTDTQALSMGFLAGFAEFIMEKVPMDNILHGDWTGNKLASFLIQMGSEGVEELGTGLLNWGADVIVMAQNSDYRKNIDAYIAQGMDEKTAEQRAFWDKMIELGWDTVGGLVMGGMSGAGRAGIQTVVDAKNIGTLKKSASIDTYRAITPDLVTRVLAETPNDKTALSIRTQMNAGGIESVKANDIYRLILKNGDTVNQMLSSAAQVIQESEAIVNRATANAAVQKAISQARSGSVSPSAYESVLKAAMDDVNVQKELGLDFSDKSLTSTTQKRAAVKAAIHRMATQPASAAAAAETIDSPMVAASSTVENSSVVPSAENVQAEPTTAEPTPAAEAAPTESVYSQSTQLAINAQRTGNSSQVSAFISKAVKSPTIMAELGVQSTGNNQKDRTAIKSHLKELAAMPTASAPAVSSTTAKAAPARASSSSSSLESYAQFAENYRKATPNATEAQIRAAYERKATSTAREGQKIFVDGKESSYDAYRAGILDLAKARGWTISEQQIKDSFDAQRKQQKELKDAADKVNKTFAKAGFGITARISYSADDFPKVKGLQGNAFFDHSKNEIVFNGNVVTVDDVVHRRLGHEIFHPSVGQKADMSLVNATLDVFAELNASGKLVGEAKRLATNMDAEIKNRVDLYKKVHGDGFTESDARVELAADLFGELFHETSLAEDIAGVKPSLASKWHKAIQKILKKFGFADDSDDIVATKIRDLESKLIDALKKRGENPDGIVNHSISSIADAAGIQAVRDEKSGRITFLDDGVPIDKVTAEHIRDRSAIGVLIKTALENKFISSADAKIQFESAAEIMNMIMTTQDPDMVWQFVGASMFSAVKSNADGQYGTTVDFSTICRKTQDMITAMSHAMKKLGRGLTKDEVTQLQKKLIEEGTPVPCPVCYVFSRWAGISAVLDKMALWQDKYADYDKQALADRIAELEKRSKAADLRKALKAEDDEYQKLNSEHEKLSRKLTGLRKQLKAAKGDDAASVKEQIDGATLQRKFIKDQMNDIEDKARGELAWLKTVRTQDGYKAVPKDILYDLENAEAFASDEYALSWKYRTTRGPSAGKAILPYADMRVGDMILGVGKNSADGNETFKVMKGELNDDQRKAVVKAIARTRAQNLIGGQRFQSTSDFRYDYALDYVLAFWEAQALGSNIQTYTKVIEFADMIAAIGGDVNLSVMPKDKGYKDGKLIFSNVTGINYEAALEANAKYDNAQLILVGINDEHIRLALEDSAETGGAAIGFVIPYHASGASIEEFISALVSNLNEQFVKENYVDYSDVQGDKVKANATEEQSRRRDLRRQLLTGRYKADNGEGKMTSQAWSPEAADFELLVGESVDISNRSFEDLRAVEKKALAGDAEAIREYESWSAGVLRDLYEKLWTSKGAYNGVRLNSTQAAAIMPHEYWNTNTTRTNAYVNGFIFRSYCYSMGLNPRFTGKNSSGKTVNHGDFSDSTGYWKTLIDRPMYRNDGTYRDQQAVNMSHFEKGMLTKEWAETHWGEYKIQEPSKTRAEQAADKFVQDTRAKEQGDLSFSLDDEAYLDAVNRNDMKTAQRMVDEAAKRAGYAYKGYHGTPNEFTEFNTDIIWFTARRQHAAEYGGRILPIYVKADKPYISEDGVIRNEDGVTFMTDDGEGEASVGWLDEAYEALDYLVANDYDAAWDEDMEYAVSLHPDHIKSADPVTYDDNGNVIPLSERFNAENNDIRYSLSDSYDRSTYSLYKTKDEAGGWGAYYDSAMEAVDQAIDEEMGRRGFAQNMWQTAAYAPGFRHGAAARTRYQLAQALEAGEFTPMQLAKYVHTLAEENADLLRDAEIVRTLMSDNYYGMNSFARDKIKAIHAAPETNVQPTVSAVASDISIKATTAVANAVIDSAPATPASIGSPAMTGEPVGAVIYERDTAADMAAAIERDPKLMALLEQYGVIPQTGKNYREVELPKRTAPKNKVSKTAVTVMGAEVTPESRLQTIDQAVVDNKLSYTPTTNQRDIQTAKRTIYRDGWDAAKGDWTAQVRAGKANSQLVAMGATLLQNMDGDEFTGQQYVDVLMDYAQLLRNAGQALQAAKILKKLTPEGKLYGMQRQVAKYNNEAGLNKTPPIEAWLDGAAEHLANRLSALTEIHIESDKAETEARKVVRILYDLAKETLPKNIRESDRAKAKERRDRLVMDRIQSIFDNKEEYTRVWNATKEHVEYMGETPIDFTDFDCMMEDLSHYTTRLLADAKFSGLAIDEGLAAQFLSAKSDEDRDAIMEMIYADLGSKVKATGMEKFTAWRYLSMLGNFRTQVRNIFGNLFFQVPRMASVTMQGALEAMLQKAGVISERSTSALYDMDTFKLAFQDFENVRDVILSGGKYQDTSSDDLMQNIEKYRTIFKSKVLEGYRKITNTAMDAGDAAFCSFTYADSLARFMKANGTTWSAASEELREKARLRAIKDAAESTYRDNNSFAEFVSKIGRARDPHNPWEKRFSTVIQGVLPFRKTPANILVRAIEYSPASLITGTVQTIRKARGNEDISGTDIVRHFSQGVTGTVLVVLGVWFASMGNLIGKAPDDDKERELWEMQGYQEYSLVVGNKSYTLDWLAPECIPLFLGANIHQAALEGGLTIGETLKALSSLTDPMLSMSMLQGINDALENATTYGDDAALTRFVGNALWGLLTQNVPTIFGQVERGFERNRMSTYIEAGAELPAVQRLIGKLSSKVPGWDSAQILYTDAWGRTQDNPQSKTLNLLYQMFSPGYVSTIETSPMEEELMRLYEATGESKVLISSAGKTITVDGEQINLTGDEYYSYSVQRGQTAYAIMTDLVNSTAYAEMDDATKAKAVEKVYDYATQIAKYDITLESYAADKWVLATRTAVAETGLPETAVVLYKCLLSAENDVNTSSVANKNIRNAIASDEALTVEQKNALDDLLISDGTYIPSDKKVDYASAETFIVTQMSDGAQTRWPKIKNQLHITAEQYQAAWKIYHNDNLNAAEKKAEFGTLIGSTQKGNLLYTLLGKKLEE